MNSELAELGDCLLAHPDVVTHILLSENGRDRVKLWLGTWPPAPRPTADSVVQPARPGDVSGLAAALRINSSLQFLYLFNNEAVGRFRIDAAFVEALWINPDRPAEWIYGHSQHGTTSSD